MKKFFTLCLMFLVAGVLNLSAGYVLTGENVNGESWNHSSATNTFTEDENGDLILTGVTISGAFKVTLDEKSWFGPVYDAKLSAGVPLVLTTNDENNCNCATTYTNCTIKLTKLSETAVAIEIISTDTQDVELSQLGENWSLIGDFNTWNDLELTKKSYGVYETWIDQATVNGLVGKGFKFRVDSNWNKGEFGSTGLSYGLNQWNILQRGGGDITTFAQPTETYDKYLLTFCVEGSAAKFRIDGYKNAAPSVETTTIELTASAQGYANAEEVASVSDPTNTIKVEFNKGTNNNTCKYYETGDAVRVYGGGYFTVTASAGENITAIELSFGSGDGSNVLSVDSGTLTDNVWSGSAKSVKFNVGGTSGHRRIQKIKVTQGEGETPTWAPVFSGISDGGHYYGNSVNYTVNAPGADKVDLSFYKDGAHDWDYSCPSMYLPYSNALGLSYNATTTEHEIIATAWKGNEYYTTSIKVTIESVGKVLTLAEFIGTEGKKQYTQGQMAKVTYQNGKYLYLSDSSGAIVVYGDGLPTFAQGDLLQNFIAEYENYYGLHEIVPLASSFENARLGNWGAPEPELITIDDVTVANQNKYVKLNGVALDNTAMTIGGVTLYNRFKVELPADGKYNVVAIVSYYNANGVADDPASVQLYPISFEEVPELVLSTVTPADGATVSSLTFVTLTFPEAVSVNSNAGSITCTGENDNKANVTVTVENEKVVLELAETSDYWAAVTYTITIPAGYFTTASGKTNSELTFTYTISDTASYELNYSSVTPAAGQVESISEISFIFPEWVKNYFSAEKATLKDADGNVVAQGEYSRSDAEGNFNTKLIRVVLDKTVTAPGTYTLTVPQGAINDRTADFSHARGNQNPEFNITYTIPEPPITYTYVPKSVTPADGSVVDAPLKNIRLAMGYDTEIKGGQYSSTEYISIVNEKGERVFEGTASIELDKTYYYYIYIYPNGSEGITEPGTYTFTIPAGCIGNEDIYNSRWKEGKVNPELTYTFTVKGQAMQVSAVAPEAGTEVESLDVITLTFPEAATFVAEATELKFDNENSYTAYVQSVEMSEDGLTATITSKPSYLGWVKGENYTLNIPAGAFVGASGAATEALSYTWSIPTVEPFTFTEVTPEQGTVESLSEIFIDFGGFRPRPTEGFSYPSYNLLDANGNTVTTAATNYSYENLDGTYHYKLKVTLGKTVTDPGTYTLTIPAGAFKDLEQSSGYNTNAEIKLSWTIPAPAMQVSAVAPEAGTEVESLDVITLAFPEAATFVAEATALTFSVTNYYKASVQSVEMSEDGLTATITSTANYPGWVTGENYTLNIPEGAFVGASGAATEALSYTWTIAAEKFTYVSVTPAQGEVTELSEILICFPNKAYGNNYTLPTLNLIDEYGAVITTASTVRAQDADGNWFAIKATLKDKVTAAGTYILQVPEDVFKDTDFGDGNTNKAFNLKWTIDSNTYTLALNIDPADGSTVTALDKISFTPGAGVMVAMATNEALTDNWFTVTDAQGNTYNSKLALEGSGYALTIEGATAAGTYTVLVPKKSFYDALTATNFNAEMTLTYTVDANKYDFVWTVNPAEGEVTELTKLVFKAANAGEMAYPSNQALSDNWVKVTDAEGNVYNTTAKAGQGYDVTIEGVSAPGTYTVTVPKGSFYDMISSMSGTMNFNDEIVLTYTIAAPEDFTPVVTPTAGTVEVEDLASIVVTLPSEFGEFNPKCDTWFDQMYFKFYSESAGYEQTLWLNSKSSITVSEDGLSITLTDWAFEFEKGVTYKFNIPAGYIVLANGAKNAETCIEYVISEGPKDLAEFTVPAGINGYINYDETNINAWAPEFPFTVSTTQNNTIAFSATLPSLPTGLTSMEVLDENGEVLVTLNQTGVAPLADGTEEYYVTGETTKEFVDGATLRFYFSFAHAGGISETIRFEYVVAGGTITGAEAITLDGNVIVRGNDIIAPEGSAIYTVSGIQVPAEGLAPGVYVVVYGNQAIKVMVK